MMKTSRSERMMLHRMLPLSHQRARGCPNKVAGLCNCRLQQAQSFYMEEELQRDDLNLLYFAVKK